MSSPIQLTEKYERNGWPAVQRPDCPPPPGWSLELVNALNHIHHHALSPNGDEVAYVEARDGRSDIFVQPLSGGWPRRLTINRAKTIYWWDSPPAWSPNGRFLAFTMNGHVHLMPADGRALPRNLTGFTASAWSPVWLPDSSGLVVTTHRRGCSQLLLTDMNGRWPRPLTDHPDMDSYDAQVEPNGRFLLTSQRPRSDLNRLHITRIDLQTGEAQPLTGEAGQKDWHPRWSPNGQQIAFLSQRSGWTNIWLMAGDGGQKRPLSPLSHDVESFAWSPDGSRIAATISRNCAVDIALIEVASGDLRYLATGQGVYSTPHWSPHGDFLTVAYEDPQTPPDVYRIDTASGQRTQITFSQLPAFAAHQLVMPELISYASYDGLEIQALLTRPAKSNQAAIVRPHGGPTDQYQFVWDPLAQYLVAKGYTFCTPNFRGSTGYGVAFEHANYHDWGGGDTQDCLYAARYLGQQPWLDPARIGIFGSSYGGYMVACCLALDPDYLYACGVSKYGDANLYSSWAQCEMETRLYTEMQIGHPAGRWDVYRAGSPIHHIANVQKPVLLLHGLNDDVVPPQASEEWAEALRRHDKVYEYKTYADEPHGFLKLETELDWQRRMERFFDWYLHI